VQRGWAGQPKIGRHDTVSSVLRLNAAAICVGPDPLVQNVCVFAPKAQYSMQTWDNAPGFIVHASDLDFWGDAPG
jgi:hypothetical protein